MFLVDLKFLIPTVISAIAALFSFLGYRRNRRYNNENHLFEKKLDASSIILGKMSFLILKIETHFIKLETIIRTDNIDKDFLNRFDDDADNFQNYLEEFESLIASKSLLLPEEIIENIEKFIEFLFSMIIPYSENKHRKDISSILENGIDRLIRTANEIDKLMRQDLNIDTLNHTLYRRLDKKTF